MRLITLLWVLSLPSLGLAAPAPPLEMDLTGRDYRNLIENSSINWSENPLAPVLDMGQRSLQWLDFINQHRPPEKRLSFSSAESELAFPITAPRFSNSELVLAEFSDLKSNLPPAIKKVLFDGEDFSADPPLSDADYISWGIKIDRNYQRGARWVLESPYLSDYESRQQYDLRGYYFLSQEKDLENRLKNWASLSSDQKANYTQWLGQLCRNTTGALSSCAKSLQSLIAEGGDIWGFYQKYLPASAKLWTSYFVLGARRSDVTWQGSSLGKMPEKLIVPFLEPTTAEIYKFLVDNIEDEWKWGDWNLNLAFQSSGLGTARVKFVPNVTPHVESIAGNTITMDANAPLSEYDVRWTIRHEFGHVLGFVDCYEEFYDPDLKVMISYQLDITNLMCSRRGHLKETHYLELKRNYAHTNLLAQ